MDVFDSLISLISQLKAELAITNNDATINPEEEAIIAAKLLIANRELIYLRKELSTQQDNKVRNTKSHSYEFLNSCGTLTHREKEVCGLLVQGEKSIEIARKLEVAAVTVKKHKASIMQKNKMNSVVLLSQSCQVKAANGCEFYDCQHTPISLIKLIEM